MKLTVKSKNGRYKVYVEDDYRLFGNVVRKIAAGGKVCLVRDVNANVDCIKTVLDGIRYVEYAIDGGEGVKTAENYVALSEFLYKEGFARDCVLIAFGGGTVSDLTGFVASTYMRGVKYINCPTTLLSAVDACIGGKTAIDIGGKNMSGTFYPPSAVYASMQLIKALPLEQLAQGKGEIAKYALLSGGFGEEELSGDIMAKTVFKCLKIKAALVKKDEFDRGARKLLNLGHTVAHAYEVASGYTLAHGEAVARGLYKIIYASKDYYGLSDEDTRDMLDVLSLSGFGEEFAVELPHADICGDKKVGGGEIDLILLKGVGKARIVKMTINSAKEALGWK